jgi:hypothetical protein
MTLIAADRTRDTTTTTGTGPFTVTGTAPTGYRTFNAFFSVSDTFLGLIAHQTANEWVVGLFTYSASNQITVTTILSSSNAGSAVTFSAGTKDVVLVQTASKISLTTNSLWSGPGADLALASVVTQGAYGGGIFMRDTGGSQHYAGMWGSSDGDQVNLGAGGTSGGIASGLQVNERGQVWANATPAIGGGTSISNTSTQYYFYAPELTGGGQAFNIEKGRPGPGTSNLMRFDIGPVGSDNASNPFWQGCHFGGPYFNEAGSPDNLVFPRFAFYFDYDTYNGPTNRFFCFDIGNDTPTTRHQFHFRSNGVTIWRYDGGTYRIDFGDTQNIPSGFGYGSKSKFGSFKSITAAAGDPSPGINAGHLFYTESLGDNTNYIGAAAGWFVAADKSSVGSGTKGVLNALNISVVPLITRNNSPFDDVVGIGIYNGGTVPGVDGIYYGRELGGSTKDWAGACIEIGAYATYALGAHGQYDNAIDVGDQSSGGNAIRTGVGPVIFGDKFGYNTGVGGTVTQATNKSTAVTLNKLCGQITMNNAALGAGAQVSFTVNNNLVAATDGIFLGTASSTAGYQVTPNRITANAFDIVVRNGTAGSLSEALVITFHVLKGVNA